MYFHRDEETQVCFRQILANSQEWLGTRIKRYATSERITKVLASRVLYLQKSKRIWAKRLEIMSCNQL